jgi:ABC-2 type transport system ATP-binding protein
MSAVICAQELSKTYVVTERDAGLGAALKSLIRRKTRQVKAVEQITFEIAPGEMVGFLGPNGAGKTSTLKMLSGLLYPTDGAATVLGFTPSKRDAAFLRQITLVMGQRNQLVWDIPAADSFELARTIYRIPRDIYKRTLDELVELLDLSSLLGKPVRNLSLGERMKCEIAGALLHSPKVLFLDEPTIGLDVTAQRRIRAFLKEYNARHGATVLLTSHYMADVEALCKRLIIIHHGHIVYDGALSRLKQKFMAYKTIVVKQGDEPLDTVQLALYGEVVNEEAGQIFLRVPHEEAARVTVNLLASFPITDVSIVEPPIEDTIAHIFALPESIA